MDNNEYEKIETAMLEGKTSYEIYLNHILSRGMHSTVYMGRIVTDNTKVVIKKLEITNKTTQEQMMGIASETSISSLIKNKNHINIVNFLDIIEDFDTVHIIMEYYEGGSLHNHLINNMLNDETIKLYFEQMVDALLHLNENNIVHCDIKPENILLDKNKKVIKLCDFGFAKKFSKIQNKNNQNLQLRGSPMYMPPEMLGNNTADIDIINSDVWALGMILYEMIFKGHPLEKCKDIDHLKKTVLEMNIKVQTEPNKIKNIACLDLLNKMLDVNSKTRISLKNIKDHEWLSK